MLNSKPYRVIKRKRDNLEDVIYYENIARVNDSILQLVNFSETERLEYFESFVEALKIKDEEEKAKAEAAERNTGLATIDNKIGGQSQNNATPNQAALILFLQSNN